MTNLPFNSSSTNQPLRWVLTFVVVIILLFAIWEVHNTLLLLLAAIILVVLFTMPIRFLVRRGMNRTPATIISLVGILALIIILMLAVLPSLVQQFAILASTVREGVEELIVLWEDPERIQQYPWLESIRFFITNTMQIQDLDTLITDLSGQIGNVIGQVGGSVLPFVGGVAASLLQILVLIFLSLYLLTDARTYEEGIIKLFPLWYRDRVRQIIDRIDFTLRIWLQGQLLLMIIVGLVSGIGLALLGLNPAGALGVLAGAFSFVPNFGPIAALVPALAVAFAQAPDKIGWVILIIYGTSFLQSQVIAPLIFKESINLPPVLVLVGQIFSAVFFGFLGIMLAVPITAILLILVQEIYIKDILGDRSVERTLHHEDELLPDGT